MLKDRDFRSRLNGLTETASADQLQSLLYIVCGQRCSQESIENDLGSAAIETILDCIENADHQELDRIGQILESQGVII